MVVDVGAGTGPLGRAAVVRWPKVRVVGVDPSERMLAVGRAEAETSLDLAARRRLTWSTGVAEQLPVETGSADAVVSSFVLQYLGAAPPFGAAVRGRTVRPAAAAHPTRADRQAPTGNRPARAPRSAHPPGLMCRRRRPIGALSAGRNDQAKRPAPT